MNFTPATTNTPNPSTPKIYKENGRVNIATPDLNKLFQMYDKNPSKQCSSSLRNATEGLWENTPLSNAFFSQQNVQMLQNGIRAGVYQKSNQQYIIGTQDYDSLKIVMRSVFLQNASNMPNNITQQIQELNQMVLNYCIQQTYSEAQGYMKYLVDASTMYKPMTRPIMSNNMDKNLELRSWF